MIKRIVIILICLMSTFSIIAQRDSVKLKENSKNKIHILTDRPPQAVYFMIGGEGPLFSAIYDRRFAKRVNGIGFSAGLGYYGVPGFALFSMPVSLNGLIGRENHFLEVGFGATFLSATTSGIFDNSKSSFLFYHLSFGYRYQPSRGGFFFRGGTSPIFFSGGSFTSFYLGFGHNF